MEKRRKNKKQKVKKSSNQVSGKISTPFNPTSNQNIRSDENSIINSEILKLLMKLFPISPLNSRNKKKYYYDVLCKNVVPSSNPLDLRITYEPISPKNILEICKGIEDIKIPLMNKLLSKEDSSLIKCKICSKKIDNPYLCPLCLNPACYNCLIYDSHHNQNLYCPICSKCPYQKSIFPMPQLDLPNEKWKIYDMLNMNYIYYCQDCNQLVSHSSVIQKEEHKNHKFLKLDEYYKGLYEMYKDNKEKMLFLFTDLHSKIESLMKIEKDFEKETMQRQEELEKFFVFLRSKLKKQSEEIKENISLEKKNLLEIEDTLIGELIKLNNEIEESNQLSFVLSQGIYFDSFKEIKKEINQNSELLKKDIIKDTLSSVSKYPSSFISTAPSVYEAKINAKVGVKRKINYFGQYVYDLVDSNNQNEQGFYPTYTFSELKTLERPLSIMLMLRQNGFAVQIGFDWATKGEYDFVLKITAFNEENKEKKLEVTKNISLSGFGYRKIFEGLFHEKNLLELQDEHGIIDFEISLKGEGFGVSSCNNSTFKLDNIIGFIKAN